LLEKCGIAPVVAKLLISKFLNYFGITKDEGFLARTWVIAWRTSANFGELGRTLPNYAELGRTVPNLGELCRSRANYE